MILVLYNILLIVGAFIWLPWMLIRSRARKEPPNWTERAGDYTLPKNKNPQRIWVHAVSVGEVVAVLPILRRVKDQLPDWEIVLTTTTSTGHQTASDKGEGVVDHLFYFPIDLPRFTVRSLARVRPKVVAVMETELWLNFLWTAKTFEATTLLINGRISEKNYGISRWIRPYYASLFGYLDQQLMQGEGDKARIESLGAKGAQVLGNCKFDQAVEGLQGSREEWRKELGIAPDDFVVVVGSTRGEEDEAIVLEGLRLAFPKLDGVKIVHAPRHLERSEPLAQKAGSIWGGAARRSKKETGAFLVLDTLGELTSVYAAADVAVIGGGFAKMGGQNLIQPLAHGVPVLHGPHMHNFRDVTAQADEAGCALVTEDAASLSRALVELRQDPSKREVMGKAARALVQANLGASDRYAAAIVAAARSAV